MFGVMIIHPFGRNPDACASKNNISDSAYIQKASSPGSL